MSKDIEISKFDTEQGYPIEDVNVFDVSVEVDRNNDLLVTDTRGNQRKAGRWRGAIGSKTENLYINSRGDLVQELNNQQPDVTYPVVKRNFVVRLATSGSGLRTNTISQAPAQFWTKYEADTVRYTDPNTGKRFRYVIPGGLAWVGTTAGATSVTSTEGVKGYAGSIWGTNYHISGSIDRNLSTYHLWGSGSLLADRWITIEYPQPVEFSGFLFNNFRTDYAVTAFDLQISDDNINFTTIKSVSIDTSTNATLLADYYVFLDSVATARFVRLQSTATINVGALKKLLLMIEENHPTVYYKETKFSNLVADERYFEFEETSENFVLSKRPDSEIDTVIATPYTNGLLKWENYCRFEHRVNNFGGGSASAGTQVRQLNTAVVNNLAIAAPLPTMILPAGVYFVNAHTSAYRTNYHTLLLTKSDGSILLNGSLSYSANSVSNGSATRSTLRSVLILEEETPVQLRDYTQTANTEAWALGNSATITADNPDNTFAVLELWKIRDIEDIEDPSAGDPYWDKVIFLLNGEGGWADQSKYQAPVMNIGAAPVVDANYGRGYDTGAGGTRYLYTLPNDRYTLGTDDFTIECWFRRSLAVSDNRAIVSNSNHVANGSWVLFLQANGTLTFHLASSPSAADIALNGPIIPLNVWTHVAMVRESNTFAMYVNGVRITSATSTRAITGDRIQVGKSSNITNTFPGIISNVRVTRGVNRYRGLSLLYTLPEEPYSKNIPDISTPVVIAQDQYFENVLLLGEANGDFKDSSIFKSAETVSGQVSIVNDAQVGNVYDFTADNANRLSYSIPLNLGTSDFTIECWYKRKDLSGNTYHLFGSSYTSATFTVSVSGSTINVYWAGSIILSYVIPNVQSWNHIAITRRRGVYYIFINGVHVTNTGVRSDNLTTGGAWWVGSSNAGHQGNHLIGSPRFTLGVARYIARFEPFVGNYTKDTVDSLPAAHGDDQWHSVVYAFDVDRSVYYDRSPFNHQLQQIGTILHQETPFVDNQNTYAIDTGVGNNGIRTTNLPMLSLMNTDFTIEVWYRPAARTQESPAIISGNTGTWDGNSWRLSDRQTWTNTKFSFMSHAFSSSQPMLTSSNDVIDGTWYHIAVVREGDIFKLFVNGNVEDTRTWSGIINTSPSTIIDLGSANVAGGNFVNGSISEARISKVARYRDNFIPNANLMPDPDRTGLDTHWASTTVLINGDQ